MKKDLNLANWSEEELLQAFLPAKTAADLLREYTSVYDIMLHVSKTQLATASGIGAARMKQLLTIREIIRRLQMKKQKNIKRIRGPEDVMEYFKFLEDKQQEELWVLLLNTKNNIIKGKCITIGTLDASLVGPREVFHVAVRYMAAAIIIVHNHPSGDSSPSEEDKAVTKCLDAASEIIGIPLLDHIIIGKYGSFSMKRQKEGTG
ncbi:JAB domain-containing protein [Pectinatus frisingensis]|uniref:JAB domain-containing protein n=1 Tax=Pectinatus frisingensis TaxID=865 RepID=UPI0018C73B1E|nr:DNA repair protein RadC [Pectinatus frisingensis]